MGYVNRTLLFSEPPIAISPTLCLVLGLQAAVFMQQLHFWIQLKGKEPKKYKNHFINGSYWVHWTQSELRLAIPLGRSCEPHKRLVRKLRNLGLLLVEQHRASDWDRTNFYTIDYRRFDEFMTQKLRDLDVGTGGVIGNNQNDFNTVNEQQQSYSSISVFATNDISTETTTDSTADTTTAVVGSSSSSVAIHLVPAAERYRRTIEKSTSGLSAQLAQEVADEVSGTIIAIKEGKRGPVNGYSKWIPSLVSYALKGELVQQFGPEVAAQRLQKDKAAVVEKLQRDLKKNEADGAKAALEAAANIINILTDCELQQIVDNVGSKIIFSSIRDRVQKDVLARRIPNGVGRAETIEAINGLQKLHARNGL